MKDTSIKWGRTSANSDDSEIEQIQQVETIGGKPKPVFILLPYGVSANLPIDCTVLMASIGQGGQDEAGIPTMPENRFRDLKEYEIKIGNYKTRANVYFNDEGTIVIEPKAGKKTVISGGTEPALKGDTTTTKNNTHVHPTAFGPSGTTSVPWDSSCTNPDLLV